jgi:hypothetical protein
MMPQRTDDAWDEFTAGLASRYKRTGPALIGHIAREIRAELIAEFKTWLCDRELETEKAMGPDTAVLRFGYGDAASRLGEAFKP